MGVGKIILNTLQIAFSLVAFFMFYVSVTSLYSISPNSFKKEVKAKVDEVRESTGVLGDSLEKVGILPEKKTFFEKNIFDYKFYFEILKKEKYFYLQNYVAIPIVIAIGIIFIYNKILK